MPTVHSEDGFDIKIYGPPREHPPPHVHVHRGSEGIIVIRLGHAPGDPPRIWQFYNVTRREAIRAFRIVEERQEFLRQYWSDIHG
jgi:hypothetical protein